MEDVLEVYTRPHDPAYPVVCLDEISKQWVAETRVPLPTAPGQPARVDYEYERHGTAHLFMTFEPLTGQRHVTVTDRRTTVDFAQEVKDLLEVRYPQAEKVILVMDHLNTHKPAALYQAFEPAVARGLLERLEIHHTLKHGSWFNRAEIELSLLSRQCLDRRIPDTITLTHEVAAWQQARHADPRPANCAHQRAARELRRLAACTGGQGRGRTEPAGSTPDGLNTGVMTEWLFDAMTPRRQRWRRSVGRILFPAGFLHEDKLR